MLIIFTLLNSYKSNNNFNTLNDFHVMMVMVIITKYDDDEE